AQKNLLDIVKEITKDGSEVVFEDKINELKKRCEEYENKAKADGQKSEKYNAYINKLLDRAILEHENKELKEILAAAEKKHPDLKSHRRTSSGISLSSGFSTPFFADSRPGTPLASPKGSPIEKDPMLKMMDDELQKLRKEHEGETAKLQAEREKVAEELKRQLAAKNKPQPEEEEKCNIKKHIGLEDKIKGLEKDIADKNAIIEALSTQNEENDPTSKISFEKLRDGKAKKDYFLPK
ncbi:8287_t:CDS:2, partial [Cetraspora pellucida]